MRYIFFALILCSCYTPKMAERQLNKAKINHPEVVAKKASEWFPCITSGESIDSSEIKQWMHIIDSINNEIQFQIDTIEIIKRDTINQKDSIAYRIIMERYKSSQNVINALKASLSTKQPVVYKTRIVIDSAKFESLASENIVLKEKKEQYQLKYERYLKICLWLLVLCTISVIINIIKLKP